MTRKSQSAKKTGLPPGSLVYTGNKSRHPVNWQWFGYNEAALDYAENPVMEGLLSRLDKKQVNWININGLHDVTLIEALGKQFNLHSLVLEDIMHTDHLPKLEDHGQYLFLTMKMLNHRNGKGLIQEHISLVLGEHFLISFQEMEGDVFSVIREGLHQGKGRLRKRGADYLFYRMLDVIVDHYFPPLEDLEGQLEKVEEILLSGKTDGVNRQIMHIRKTIQEFRRWVIPLREELRRFRQKDFSLVHPDTYKYLDDVFDHLLHLSSTLDGYRDMTTSLLELMMAANSNRMNNVMKTLTVFAAIFMPLTFLAGIYGMNFQRMPELEWHWGYPAILAVMGGVAVTMLLWMKRKKWL